MFGSFFGDIAGLIPGIGVVHQGLIGRVGDPDAGVALQAVVAVFSDGAAGELDAGRLVPLLLRIGDHAFAGNDNRL